MKLIGLTGGIGSGKTTVAAIFETLAVPVFYADKVGRELLENDKDVIAEVRSAFGEAVMLGNKPDRRTLANLVFRDESLLQKLNTIIHPAVVGVQQQWLRNLGNEHPYCLKEAAILFESGSYKDCDEVICVAADEETRIERIMRRDGSSREQVLQRMARQWPEHRKIEMSQYTINNSGSLSLVQQVLKIDRKLRSKLQQ